MAVPIVDLRHADLAQLQALLHVNRLPFEDCAEPELFFCGIFDGDELVAAGGLEPAGCYALLRSVVVRQNHRSRGLARRITTRLLRRAEGEGRSAVYLLTETATDYFARLGFQALDRADVPHAVARTRQFTTLCPRSASCMRFVFPFDASPK